MFHDAIQHKSRVQHEPDNRSSNLTHVSFKMFSCVEREKLLERYLLNRQTIIKLAPVGNVELAQPIDPPYPSVPGDLQRLQPLLSAVTSCSTLEHETIS